MQVEPPIVTITGFNRGMRKAAVEIRETLAVGRADLDKFTWRDKAGGLGCKSVVDSNLAVFVLMSM